MTTSSIFEFKAGPSSETVIPRELWETHNPPQSLFIQGEGNALELLKGLPERGLAIVGTRRPQPRSIVYLKSQIRSLQGSSLIILSGLARGIDTVVHETALEAGLPTIAIVGSGLDVPYPRENEPLRKQIIQRGGLIISEYPLGTPPLSHHFLRRNRLIAGWSKATWVVEAAMRSGALNTARWARDQNKTCFAVPGFPGDPALAGNQILLDRDHALAYWGVHSLGAAWIDLVSHMERTQAVPSTQGSTQSSTHAEDDLILEVVKRKTREQGAVQVSELLAWAIHQGWEPQKFYTVFHQNLRQKRLIQENNFVLSI